MLVAFDDSGDLPRERRLYTGPPAGPLRLEFARRIPGAAGGSRSDVDVDADRVLLSELRFPRLRSRLRVLAPGAPPARVPLPGRLLPGPFALAGDHVALGGASRLFVVDRRSGDREASTALGAGDVAFDVDLRPTAVPWRTSTAACVTVAPGQPRAVVPGSGGHSLSKPQFAGSRIGALEQTGFIVAPGRPRPWRRAAARRRLAVDRRSETSPPTSAVSPGSPTAASSTRRSTALRRPSRRTVPARARRSLFDETDQRLHGRRVRLEVTCIAAPAPGCLGSLVLRDRGIAGRGRFSVPAGATAVVDAVLNRRGARRVRRALRRVRRGVPGARRAPAGRPRARRQPEPVDRDRPRRAPLDSGAAAESAGGRRPGAAPSPAPTRPTGASAGGSPGSPSTAPRRMPTTGAESGSPANTCPPQCAQKDFGMPFGGLPRADDIRALDEPERARVDDPVQRPQRAAAALAARAVAVAGAAERRGDLEPDGAARARAGQRRVRRCHARTLTREPVPVGDGGGLGAGAHVELAEDPGDVDAGGLLRHVQRRADLAVGGALGDAARAPGARVK